MDNLEVHEFEDGTAMVLRDLGGAQPYATHWRGQNGDYWWGHYFEKEEEAREDFKDRVRKTTDRTRR
jgi:hypothetical protein